MKGSASTNLPKRVLILFPAGRLGEKIVRSFAREGYEVYVIALGSEQRFQLPDETPKPVVATLNDGQGTIWEKLPRDTTEAILTSPVVIYYAGRDFLRLKASGKHEEWQIDHRSESQRRFAFVDHLLSKFAEHPPRLWINLAVGMTGHHEGKANYCRTRYGMLGFSKVLELHPRFQDMVVRNICLTFFAEYRTGAGMDHCEMCTTQELRDTLTQLTDEDDLVRFLLRETESALTRWPTSLP